MTAENNGTHSTPIVEQVAGRLAAECVAPQPGCGDRHLRNAREVVALVGEHIQRRLEAEPFICDTDRSIAVSVAQEASHG